MYKEDGVSGGHKLVLENKDNPNPKHTLLLRQYLCYIEGHGGKQESHFDLLFLDHCKAAKLVPVFLVAFKYGRDA